MSWLRKEKNEAVSESSKPKTCWTCKCLIAVGEEKIIQSYGFSYINHTYCHKCAPKYSHISYDSAGNAKYYMNVTIECDENGNEVKKC